MTNKRQIIATGITNLTDARYFAAMGVDWMGFDLRKEPRISIEQMHAIMDWVEGPQWLVEVGDERTEGIPKEVTCIIHPVGSHPTTWTGTCVKRLTPGETPGISANPVLVTLSSDEHTQRAQLDQLADLQASTTVWLNADWTANIMENVLAKLPRAGIVLTGSSEEAVGVKAYDIVDALFELFETED